MDTTENVVTAGDPQSDFGVVLLGSVVGEFGEGPSRPRVLIARGTAMTAASTAAVTIARRSRPKRVSPTPKN